MQPGISVASRFRGFDRAPVHPVLFCGVSVFSYSCFISEKGKGKIESLPFIIASLEKFSFLVALLLLYFSEDTFFTSPMKYSLLQFFLCFGDTSSLTAKDLLT